MSTICAEHHNFFHSNQPIKDLLLFSSSCSPNSSPRRLDSNFSYETNLHKFLPSNNNGASDDDENGSDCDPYGTDHFRMYEFKVRRCTRSRSHDWTDCPFAHPAEKARRRDPRRFRYSSTVCADFRRGGGCPRGDDCEFAHGVFECWLHPTRYRTEACKDGTNCGRKVCFFAHSPRELRILPESPPTKYKNGAGSCVSPLNKKNPCCLFCNCHSSSPTSTLLGLSQFSRSPSLSPPLSPIKTANSLSGYSHSPVSRLSKFSSEMATAVTYKDVLNELMNSIDSINFNEISSPIGSAANSAAMNSIDSINFNEISSPIGSAANSAAMNFNDISSPIGSAANSAAMNSSIPWLDCGEEQQQFVLSPVPSLSEYSGEAFFSKGFSGEHEKINDNAAAAPDLGWVNDLLM